MRAAALLALTFGLAAAPAVAVAQHAEIEPGSTEAAAERIQGSLDEEQHVVAEEHAVASHAPPPINWTDFGYRKKDAFGGSLGDGQLGEGDHARALGHDEGEEPMAPPFALALLNFAIFAGLLIKFAGPKVSSYLRNRHDTIKGDLAEAARLRGEAEKKLAEYSTRMAKVNAEVDQLIGEIRAEAEAEKTQILADAKAQAVALKKDAEDRISSEIARARHELEREVVAAAVAAAERVLREQTTPTDQRALFDGFLASLTPGGASMPPSSTPPATPASSPAGDDSVSKGWS
jgi:F-type H+-transporting ATPase subunit b